MWAATLALALALSPNDSSVASGTIAKPAETQAVPAMTYEKIPARSASGELLGTMIVPAIVDPARRSDATRPLLVVFNGGPGASSGWLQLGLLGPWRAVLPDDPAAAIDPHPPLEPNRQGLWDVADILFIDPLGTGFSRAAPGVPASAIHDWRRDGDYIAGIIREWMVRHGRPSAPLVLMGESYGAERATAVADTLSRQPGQSRIAGMVFISQTVTIERGLRNQDPALGNAIGLPTIAATACYFGTSRLPENRPEACARRAQSFAMTEYLPSMSRAAVPVPARRQAVTATLARMTGLPANDLARSDMPLTRQYYRYRALAESGRVLGIYDSRYVAPRDPSRVWQDPSLDPVLPAMEDAANRYNRITLGFDRSPVDAQPYVLFSDSINGSWRYDGQLDPYRSLRMTSILTAALHRSGANLLIAGGMFDNVGSYGADRYLASHLALPADRIAVQSYPAGHMFYLDSANRLAFLPVLRGFVAKLGQDKTEAL